MLSVVVHEHLDILTFVQLHQPTRPSLVYLDMRRRAGKHVLIGQHDAVHNLFPLERAVHVHHGAVLIHEKCAAVIAHEPASLSIVEHAQNNTCLPLPNQSMSPLIILAQ